MSDDPYATRLPPPEPDQDPHATVHRPEAVTAPSIPPVDVVVPRARPPRRTGLRRARGVAATVAGLIGAGVIGYSLHPSPKTAAPAVTTPTPPPLAVTGMTIASKVGTLHCPSAVLRLSGVIRTNASGGTARLQWVLPTGTTEAQDVEIPAGRTSTAVTLAFTLTGRGAAAGQARLHLLQPADVYSAPVGVRYVCP